MVYISHPTEYGTLYSLEELKELSKLCREYKIPFYMDGARLGYGLMSHGTDVTLPDIAELLDVFYIGGTKIGALCGEAVVFTHHNTPKYFLTTVKQHGALLAKGRLLGVQFDTLFTDNLYMEISRNAIETADVLKIFIVLENERLESLKKQVKVSFWEKADEEHTVVRLATSWATAMEEIEALREFL